MSGEELQDQQQETPPGAQPETSAEQPLTEETPETTDESRTPEAAPPAEETDEQKAARLVKEQEIRRRRERNRAEAERRLAEKERDTYRAMVERLIERDRAPTPVSQESKPPTRDFNPETGKPFETYDEFVVAQATWKAEQKALQTVQRQMEHAAQAYQEQLQRFQQDQTRQQHHRRMDEYAKQNPDFEEVAARDDIEIPKVAGAILEQMTNGPALIHTIAQQPQIAATLRGMESPLEMATYLGQLSQWLSSSRSSKISNAAPVGKTVGSKPASSSTPPDDPDEYERWANKRFGRR